MQRLSHRPESFLPYSIALIASNPEDNAVLLVNDLTATAVSPDVSEFATRQPLTIDIDSPGIAVRIGLNWIGSIILHNLQRLCQWFKFTYDNLAGPL